MSSGNRSPHTFANDEASRRLRRRTRARLAVMLDLTLLIVLPVAVVLVARLTALGPTVATFRYNRSEGLHAGDVIALFLAGPVWCSALLDLTRRIGGGNRRDGSRP